MAKNNSSNQDYTNNSDGFDLSGGTTKRKLTLTGADITLTGSGSNTYTYPASTDTLVGRASTDTLTNKTLTAPVINTATIGTSLVPTSNDGAPLGDTTHQFSDLFLATGAVLNYANGNVAITHASGILTMGTGEFRITTPGTNSASIPTLGSTSTLTNKTLTSPVLTTATITTSLVPTTDDGAALGSASNRFSDIFLASGGVVDWANGVVTLTQASTTRLEIGGSTGAVMRVPSVGGFEIGSDTGITRSSAGIIAVGGIVVPTISSTNTLTNKTLDAGSNTITNLGIANFGGITGTPGSGNFLRGDGTWQNISGGGDALTSGTLAQFASTTSLQLKGVISDETGSGALVFGTSPTITTPVITAPTGFLTGAASITVSTSAPGSPVTGDLWIDTN